MPKNKDTTEYLIRHIPRQDWIDYHVICKQAGISAAESLRRHITETVLKRAPQLFGLAGGADINKKER